MEASIRQEMELPMLPQALSFLGELNRPLGFSLPRQEKVGTLDGTATAGAFRPFTSRKAAPATKARRFVAASRITAPPMDSVPVKVTRESAKKTPNWDDQLRFAHWRSHVMLLLTAMTCIVLGVSSAFFPGILQSLFSGNHQTPGEAAGF